MKNKENNNLKEEIFNLISETLEIPKEKINEKANLVSDLELESLDLVDLIAAFENKYNIEILDKDIKTLQTVGDIIKYIENKNAYIINSDETTTLKNFSSKNL